MQIKIHYNGQVFESDIDHNFSKEEVGKQLNDILINNNSLSFEKDGNLFVFPFGTLGNSVIEIIEMEDK